MSKFKSPPLPCERADAGSILLDETAVIRSDRIGKPFRENAVHFSYNQIRVGHSGIDPLIKNSTPLQITLFGPLHVMVNGKAIARPSKKALCVLAMLGLRAGRSVDRAWLAETLWPETDLEHGLSSLRQALSELRRALGDQMNRVRAGGSQSIALDIDGARIDAIDFDELVKIGGPENWAAAIELYQAPLLEDWQDEWVAPERQARQEACLNALKSLAQFARESNDLASEVKHCRQACTIDPLSDEMVCRLMEALERSGDRNTAVRAYHDYADRLERELGLSPDEKTTKVCRRIQKALRSRDHAQTTVTADSNADRFPKGNISLQDSDLVGREDECNEVAALLRRSRLVTLTGFGGIGKSRLGLEVARRVASEYEDGAWLIPISSITDSRLIFHQFAQVLSLSEEKGMNLSDNLKDKKMLLVLDNCEHLLSEVDKVVASTLKICPGIRILATSRTALGITGEMVSVVPALGVPNMSDLQISEPAFAQRMESFDSVRLYVRRAASIEPEFAMDSSNSRSIGALCSRLEGIPLAIELAAARVASTSAEQFTVDLGPLLEDSPTTSRQQTLRETLDWSFNLLDPSEQILFRRLSIFMGGWFLDAAEKVCSDTAEAANGAIFEDGILSLLSSLVEKSMVVYSDDGQGGRYTFLEIVRQYAAEVAARFGENALLGQRHVAWAVEAAEAAELLLKEVDQTKGLWRLDRDHDNFRSALDRCEAVGNGEAAMRISGALGRFWLMRNSITEGRRHVARALEIDKGRGTPRWRASALSAAAVLACRQGDYDEGKKFGEECLAIRRLLHDARGVASAAGNLGNIFYIIGDYASARRHFSESADILEKLGLKALLGLEYASFGMVASAEGNYEEALALLRMALELFQENRPYQGTGWVAWIMGWVESELGNLERAEEHFGECKRVAEAQNDSHGDALALHGMAIVARLRGKLDLSKDIFKHCLSIARDLGSRRDIADLLIKLGQVADLSGDATGAEKCFHEGLTLTRDLSDRTCEMDCLTAMSQFESRRGNHPEAKSLALASLDICRQIQRKMVAAANLQTWAAAEMSDGQPELAVTLWATASSLRRVSRAPMPKPDIASYESRLSEARRHLGNERFTEIWSQSEARSWLETEEMVRMRITSLVVS